MKYEKPSIEEMDLIIEGSFLQDSTGVPGGGLNPYPDSWT